MKSKLLTLLLSVTIAFGLWLYVVTVVDPESESPYYDVPVVFDGLSVLSDRNLMIISGNTATVDLRLLTVIYPEEYENLTTVELSDRIYNLMAEDLGPDRVAQE